MLVRFFVLLVGFGLSVAGGISLLAYMNYMAAGYTFYSYVEFIVHRIEFYIFVLGLLFIAVSIYFPQRMRGNKE
ncbi:hypothetical protein ACFPU1_06940 [Thalassorhabdus alkalitolerans]|uniref:Uncharacterized protein n=1 Tax=Thalassorhabdus alkalitolerans TaxID=2282697 RepID=A0ABW0YMK8_9BACI|nr:hypothetical protein [Thalassobacillus sp. C254]